MLIFLNPMEPIELGILRLIVITLLIFSIVVLTGLKFTRLNDLGYVYYTSHDPQRLGLPNILIRSIHSANYSLTSTVSYSPAYRPMSGSQHEAPESTVSTKLIEQLEWGRHVKDSGARLQDWKWQNGQWRSSDDTEATLYMASVMPHQNVYFMPLAGITKLRQDRALLTDQQLSSSDSDYEEQPTYLSSLNITIGAQDFSQPGGLLMNPGDTVIEVFVLNNGIISEEVERQHHGPIDLSTISNAARCTFTWGAETTIGFRRRDVSDRHTNDLSIVNYDIQFRQVQNPRNNTITLYIKPLNDYRPRRSYRRDEYRVETRRGRQLSQPWDVIVTTGSALSLSLLLYTLLFGQQKVRPWGFVQRYFMRESILKRVPPRLAVKPQLWKVSTAPKVSGADKPPREELPDFEQRIAREGLSKDPYERAMQHRKLEDCQVQRGIMMKRHRKVLEHFRKKLEEEQLAGQSTQFGMMSLVSMEPAGTTVPATQAPTLPPQQFHHPHRDRNERRRKKTEDTGKGRTRVAPEPVPPVQATPNLPTLLPPPPVARVRGAPLQPHSRPLTAALSALSSSTVVNIPEPAAVTPGSSTTSLLPPPVSYRAKVKSVRRRSVRIGRMMRGHFNAAPTSMLESIPETTAIASVTRPSRLTARPFSSRSAVNPPAKQQPFPTRSPLATARTTPNTTTAGFSAAATDGNTPNPRMVEDYLEHLLATEERIILRSVDRPPRMPRMLRMRGRVFGKAATIERKLEHAQDVFHTMCDKLDEMLAIGQMDFLPPQLLKMLPKAYRDALAPYGLPPPQFDPPTLLDARSRMNVLQQFFQQLAVFYLSPSMFPSESEEQKPDYKRVVPNFLRANSKLK